MSSPEAVVRFCERQSWRLVETIDLGTTASIYVVEIGRSGQRYALKTQRDLDPQDHAARTDWGTARIGSPLTDVTNLLTYAHWSEDESGRFLRAYFDDDPAALTAALPCLQTLARLYRYRSCVQSLRWLNEMGEQGLDPVGRAHFGRVLNLL